MEVQGRQSVSTLRDHVDDTLRHGTHVHSHVSVTQSHDILQSLVQSGYHATTTPSSTQAEGSAASVDPTPLIVRQAAASAHIIQTTELLNPAVSSRRQNPLAFYH